MQGSLRPAIAWSILILAVCLLPSGAVPGLGLFSQLHLDKLVHAFLYGVLAILLFNALVTRTLGKGKGLALFTVSICAAYGGAIELLQEIPQLGRSAEWGDLLADTAGAAIGVVIARYRSK